LLKFWIILISIIHLWRKMNLTSFITKTRKIWIFGLLTLICFTLITSSRVTADTSFIYVDWDASGNNDGTSWTDAYTDLQDALLEADAGDEIWVAAGTYKPTGDSDRSVTFQMESGVAIYGGFPAAGGDWEDRDLETNISILSGDIAVEENSADNSYHVVTGTGVDGTAILDGFTISDGNANAEPVPHIYGGGMYISDGNPTLNNLVFYANTAAYGGGMFNLGGNPILTNVVFSANIASESGGGMYNYQCSPVLINVTFSENTSLWGGGIYNNYSSPEIINATFFGNIAPFGNYGRGGGMYNDHSSPILTNATFSGNTARFGGGMFNAYLSNPTLAYVTFTGNTADLSYTNGGGVSNQEDCNPTITNSIFWNNQPDQISNSWNSSTEVTYSVVQGGYSGEGNISGDPLLQSLVNNGGFTQTHALGAGSPAIDTADPENCLDTDQRGVPRPQGDFCDMGAYEYEFPPELKDIFLPLILR
jgi:hypothetical protein